MRPFIFFLALVFLTPALRGQQFEVGKASYYNDALHGQVTALGETYDRQAYTCAHRWHPKGTLLEVTNLDNQESVVVRVNDRGPYSEGYLVNLSLAAANSIGLTLTGKANVGVKAVGFSEQNAYAAGAAPAAQSFAPAAATFTSRGGDAEQFDTQAVRFIGPGQKGFVIQIGAYTDYSNAANQIIALQQRGVRDVYLLEGANQSGPVYRIVLGTFGDKVFAEQFRQRLKVEYQIDGVVTGLK